MAEEVKDQVLLTPKEMAWVDAYFESFNATEASVQVYGPYDRRDSARTHGWRMLQRQAIKDEVEIRLRSWRAARRMTVEEFGDQLADAVKTDIQDFFEEDGQLKPLSEMPPHARKQIASIEFETDKVKVGTHPITDEPIYEVVRIPKIKLWDRRKAEELWGKWKKMYTDKVDVGGQEGNPVRVAFSINGIKK